MKPCAVLLLVAFLLWGLLAAGCRREQPPPGDEVIARPPPPPPAEEPEPMPAEGELEAPAGAAQEKPYPDIEGTVVKVETEKGDIVLALYDEDLPRTVGNFRQLVKDGYYDGRAFYRVEDWVIQAGENPRGLGPGLKFETSPKRTHDRGALGLARTDDPNSGKTEFYIVKKDSHFLDDEVVQRESRGSRRGYCCFGRTIEGLDVVDSIQPGDGIKQASIIQEPQ